MDKKEFTGHCVLCGIEFPKTGDDYAKKTESGQRYRSEHHLIPKRFEKYDISQRTLAEKLGIETQNLDSIYLCYECHEELLQNPIFTTKMIEGLSSLMRGKSLEDKVVILSHVIQLGIKEAIKEIK